MDTMKISNDINGNPRLVVHFFELLTEQEQRDIDRAHRGGEIGASINAMYEAALKKAKSIGGKKYHTKHFGGGIVFQAYNGKELANRINEIKGGV
jgi:hypothetical protein